MAEPSEGLDYDNDGNVYAAVENSTYLKKFDYTGQPDSSFFATAPNTPGCLIVDRDNQYVYAGGATLKRWDFFGATSYEWTPTPASQLKSIALSKNGVPFACAGRSVIRCDDGNSAPQTVANPVAAGETANTITIAPNGAAYVGDSVSTLHQYAVDNSAPPALTAKWSHSHSSLTSVDAVAATSYGVYVTGAEPAGAGQTPDGQLDSVTVFGDSEWSVDAFQNITATVDGTAVAVDKFGDLYVGTSTGHLIKYTADGKQVFQQANTTGSTAGVTALAVDERGRVYVGGSDGSITVWKHA